jgi:hypothetical protein
MAFHVDDGALYVLDRDGGPTSPIRLLRITPAGAVSVLTPDLFVTPRDTASLSIGEDGGLLLAAAKRDPPRTEISRVRLRGGGVERCKRLILQGETLAGDARETEGGIAYLIEVQGGFSPRVVPRAAVPAAPPDAPADPMPPDAPPGPVSP